MVRLFLHSSPANKQYPLHLEGQDVTLELPAMTSCVISIGLYTTVTYLLTYMLTILRQTVHVHKPCIELCWSEYASFLTELSVRQDQLGIEQRQQHERQYETDHVVHEVHVQPSVEGT